MALNETQTRLLTTEDAEIRHRGMQLLNAHTPYGILNLREVSCKHLPTRDILAGKRSDAIEMVLTSFNRHKCFVDLV